MRQVDHTEWTIFPVKRGHLKSVICRQSPSVLKLGNEFLRTLPHQVQEKVSNFSIFLFRFGSLLQRGVSLGIDMDVQQQPFQPETSRLFNTSKYYF
jgi:hypothetical protein